MSNTENKINLPDALREKIGYLAGMPEDEIPLFVDIFVEGYEGGRKDELLYNWLVNHYPKLRGLNIADINSLLDGLEKAYLQERTKVEDVGPDVFYLDEKGRRKINYEILIDGVCNHFIFKVLRDTEAVSVSYTHLTLPTTPYV